MTSEEFRLQRVTFKRFMHAQLKFFAAICAVSSVLAIILLLCLPHRFIRIRVITAVLVVYIVYVILSLIDVVLLWIHRNNPVSTDIAEFTGNNDKNTIIKDSIKKEEKGVKSHARGNDQDSNRHNETSERDRQ